MAADFNKPALSSNKTNFPAEIRDNVAAVAKMDFTGASNIPANSIQYDHTNRRFQRESSSSFPALGGLVPPGGIVMWGKATAPTGWLLCDGTAYSRTTYAELYAEIGDTYGAGNGTTTFNVPDFRQRFPLGKAASGTGSTLGGTGGNIDHTHTVPAHYHSMGTGADLNITSGGAHTHSIDHDHGSVTSGSESSHTHAIDHNHAAFDSAAGNTMTNYNIVNEPGTGSNADSFVGYLVGDPDYATYTSTNWPGRNHTHSIDVPAFTGTSGAGSSHTHSVDLPNFTGTSGSTSHTHTSGTFSGRIGLVTGGVDGNASMTSGTANPPFLTVNFIIKY